MNTTAIAATGDPGHDRLPSLPSPLQRSRPNFSAVQTPVGRCCNYSAQDELRRFSLLIIDGRPFFVAACDRPLGNAYSL
jgi:hypothetical protein